MLGIGIHKDVILTKAVVNEKGSLVLSFDELKNLTKPESNIFESSQTAKVDNTGKTSVDIQIFPFGKPKGDRNKDKTDDELLEMISGDISRTKSQLTQLLLVYTTSDQVNWDPYAQTGVTKENYREQLLNNSTLETVFSNYAHQFITMVTPFAGDQKLLLRIKLIRQSKDKNFATIPGRFLEDQPWVESMDVPDKLSKVTFTKWEIENGYDSAAPAANKAAADNKEQEIEDTAASQDNVFGKR